MRLFVAVWPDEAARRALSSALLHLPSDDLRWVPESEWHVTLDFLGPVPNEELNALRGALGSLGPSLAAATATLGPKTRVLGRAVLCVPVAGLDDLAKQVREVTRPFRRSGDADLPFLGHLTLARPAQRHRIPAKAGGTFVWATWPVQEFTLVASDLDHHGSRYQVEGVVTLGR